MAQSDGDFKLNSDVSPKVVSRDSKVRTLEENQKIKIESNQPTLAEEKSNRRDMMKSIVPASGKVLAGFLRTFGTGLSEVLEKLEGPQKK